MKKHKIIGLTGQTGAGKSTVSKIFSKNGAIVINADELVSRLYTPESVCLKTLAAQFGNDILFADKTLDRKRLAQKAFASKESTALLGEIVHPFVLSLFLKKADIYVKKGYGCIVFDAPQLFESKSNLLCDYIISVTANRNLRLERICKRDKISEKMAESRINAQLSEDFFKENSDYIIENNGSKQQLRQKAEKLITALI